jgi:hypothetical protein
MAALFLDGFDKYGPPNSNSTTVVAVLGADWSTVTAPTSQIVAGLSSTGNALTTGNSATLTKALGTNATRLIGGLRINGNLAAQVSFAQFRDGANIQCTLSLETTGAVTLRSGNNSGTILSSAGAISGSSTHYIEWDITFGATGAYQVWLDGVSLFTGSGNTRAGSTNNYANTFAVFTTGAAQTTTIDDLYIFDGTGTTNNAPLLVSPRIETTYPISDSAVQFGFGAATIGSTVSRVTGNATPVANSLNLRRFTPTVAATLNSISLMPTGTSATANYRGVVYADSGGVAGTLLSSGTTVTGATANAILTLPLTTPQSLSAGTPYWLGYMNDTVVNNAVADGGNAFSRAAATFTSGAPGTAPAMTVGQPSVSLWGNLTGVAGNNWYESSLQPPPGASSYVFDATVGHEDLYNFGALSAIPASIYALAVKGYIAKSDTGAKTLSLRMKSGATDSAGSLSGQAPGTSFLWLGSMFETDPNTGAAWTGTALNSATSGVHVDS